MSAEKVIRGRMPEINTSARTLLQMTKHAMIALASPVAQQFHNPRGVRRHHGSSDYGVAADIALHLNGYNEEATAAWLKWADIHVRGTL